MELLRLPLVMLVSTPLWFSIRTVPEEDVCVHRIVLVMFTCGGRVTLHTNKIASNGATSNTVIVVGFMSTTKTGSKIRDEKKKFFIINIHSQNIQTELQQHCMYYFAHDQSNWIFYSNFCSFQYRYHMHFHNNLTNCNYLAH